MKLKFNLLMMLAVVFMAACSDDDEPTVTPAQEIAGTYTGYSVAEFKYSSIPTTTPGESITFSANEDGTCIISFESKVWGETSISAAEVLLKSDNYEITGSGEIVIPSMTGGDSVTKECELAATIGKDKKIESLVITISDLMGGTTITLTEGDAPAAMVIAKKYTGIMDVTVSETPYSSYEEHAVTITSQEDGKAQIVLQGFGEGAMALEDLTITDVEVTEENDTYTVNTTVDTTSGDWNITGTLEGTITDGIANIVFSLKPGSMPMYLVCTFTGE